MYMMKYMIYYDDSILRNYGAVYDILCNIPNWEVNTLFHSCTGCLARTCSFTRSEHFHQERAHASRSPETGENEQ